MEDPGSQSPAQELRISVEVGDPDAGVGTAELGFRSDAIVWLLIVAVMIDIC